MILSKRKSNNTQPIFYYGPLEIELCDEYKYLGVIVHCSGKLTHAAANLTDRARKTCFATKSKIPNSDTLSVKSWLHLINSIVIPVQTYASEIWICDFKVNFDTIDKLPSEKLQNMIFENVLDVHGKASNLAVPTEMGSLPVCMKAYKLLYKYCLRLQSFDEHPDSLHTILRASYKEDSKLSQSNKSAK